MSTHGKAGGAVITSEPPSVIAARQLADEAYQRRSHVRRSRPRPLKLQPLRSRPGRAGAGG